MAVPGQRNFDQQTYIIYIPLYTIDIDLIYNIYVYNTYIYIYMYISIFFVGSLIVMESIVKNSQGLFLLLIFGVLGSLFALLLAWELRFTPQTQGKDI